MRSWLARNSGEDLKLDKMNIIRTKVIYWFIPPSLAFGPHHFSSSSGLVHALNTRSGGAGTSLWICKDSEPSCPGSWWEPYGYYLLSSEPVSFTTYSIKASNVSS